MTRNRMIYQGGTRSNSEAWDALVVESESVSFGGGRRTVTVGTFPTPAEAYGAAVAEVERLRSEDQAVADSGRLAH